MAETLLSIPSLFSSGTLSPPNTSDVDPELPAGADVDGDDNADAGDTGERALGSNIPSVAEETDALDDEAEVAAEDDSPVTPQDTTADKGASKVPQSPFITLKKTISQAFDDGKYKDAVQGARSDATDYLKQQRERIATKIKGLTSVNEHADAANNAAVDKAMSSRDWAFVTDSTEEPSMLEIMIGSKMWSVLATLVLNVAKRSKQLFGNPTMKDMETRAELQKIKRQAQKVQRKQQEILDKTVHTWDAFFPKPTKAEFSRATKKVTLLDGGYLLNDKEKGWKNIAAIREMPFCANGGDVNANESMFSNYVQNKTQMKGATMHPMFEFKHPVTWVRVTMFDPPQAGLYRPGSTVAFGNKCPELSGEYDKAFLDVDAKSDVHGTWNSDAGANPFSGSVNADCSGNLVIKGKQRHFKYDKSTCTLMFQSKDGTPMDQWWSKTACLPASSDDKLLASSKQIVYDAYFSLPKPMKVLSPKVRPLGGLQTHWPPFGLQSKYCTWSGKPGQSKAHLFQFLVQTNHTPELQADARPDEPFASQHPMTEWDSPGVDKLNVEWTHF